MRITKEQNDILDSFTCERFRKNPKNFDLMKEFKSNRGTQLINYLINVGKDEEYENQTAYYIIKNNYGKPLMFFSLKCGSLFEPLTNLDENPDYQRMIVILQAIVNAKDDPENAAKANELIEGFFKDNNINFNDAIQLIRKALQKKKNRYARKDKQLALDEIKEENENISRVLRVHPGIELMHFCTNDLMKDYWKTLGMNRHKMGEVLYWYFIVPVYAEIQKIVGCEYAFLFAADISEDGALVNYYDNILKFKKKMDIGTTKPFYDFACEFMCQEINQILSEREIFFNNFNDDIEDAV